MAVFPSLYQAKVIQANGHGVRAFVPQVFGDQAINVTRCVGSFPSGPGMGWVAFQGGNPAFPVWMGAGITIEIGGGNGDGEAPILPPTIVPDEVWIGPGQPTDEATELWYDTDEPSIPSAPVLPVLQVSWTSVTVWSNGWAAMTDNYMSARYRKIQDIVYVEGAAKSGVVGAMWTMPVTYRPPKSIEFQQNSLQGPCVIGVEPTGVVSMMYVPAGGNARVTTNFAYSVTL